MKVSAEAIKALVLSLVIASAGHVLATDWFNVTAVNNDLSLSGANTNGIPVSVAENTLSIDLPTNTVFQITPSDPAVGQNGKTYIDVDGAEFTPTYTNDIDNTVVQNAQTALTVAYDEANATNYYAYIGGDWVKLIGPTPVNAPVNVHVELDYSNAEATNVSFTVGGVLLSDASENTRFQISGAQRALGHIELAGYGKLHAITSTVEEVVNVTVTPGTVTYGADFTNVTITATLSGTGYAGATYTLTWNNESVDAVASVVGDTLTLTAEIRAPATGRAPATYVINVNGVAGETQNTVVADNRDWITEDSTHTGPTGTGTWEPTVTYTEAVAAISENTYKANNCSTGDLVTITFEKLVYTELSDLEVTPPTGGVQGAFALAETNINETVSTNFMILAGSLDNYYWIPATCDGVTANTNIEYDVVMTFDYVNNTYSVKVNNSPLTINSNEEQFNLCVVKSEVTDFVFKGSGTMVGIKGVESTGYMAKDAAGHWYATLNQAAKSGNNGPFIVLRSNHGDAPSGWKFVTENGIEFLKKAARGMFFFAF